MVVSSATFEEFVERCNANGSAWKDIEYLDQIHEAQVEKELRALEDLARQGKALDSLQGWRVPLVLQAFARASSATLEALLALYCRLLPPQPIAKLSEGNKVTGAGDGNRTRVRSLGSFYTAIVRRPL